MSDQMGPGSSNASTTATPPPPPSPPPHDPEYELLLISTGSLTERPSSLEPPLASASPPVTSHGRLQVLQRRLPPPSNSYIAVLSVDDINVPLGLGNPCTHGSNESAWDITVESGRVFCVKCTGTDPDKRRLEEILRWFTKVEGQQEKGWGGKLDEIGRKGEVWVEQVGDRVNQRIKERIGNNGRGNLTEGAEGVDEASQRSEGSVRNVKLGGKVTKGVLGGVRGVTEKGAQVTHTITEKVSGAVGTVLGGNPLMTNMKNAPVESKRNKFHKLITSGMMAVGRVYLKADEKGKVIITTVGDELGKKAGEQYGEEAESATRNMARIGLNSYRIMRFPNKLGASALLKGAVKGAFKQDGGIDPNQEVQGTGTGPFVPSSI